MMILALDLSFDEVAVAYAAALVVICAVVNYAKAGRDKRRSARLRLELDRQAHARFYDQDKDPRNAD